MIENYPKKRIENYPSHMARANMYTGFRSLSRYVNSLKYLGNFALMKISTIMFSNVFKSKEFF